MSERELRCPYCLEPLPQADAPLTRCPNCAAEIPPQIPDSYKPSAIEQWFEGAERLPWAPPPVPASRPIATPLPAAEELVILEDSAVAPGTAEDAPVEPLPDAAFDDVPMVQPAAARKPPPTEARPTTTTRPP